MRVGKGREGFSSLYPHSVLVTLPNFVIPFIQRQPSTLRMALTTVVGGGCVILYLMAPQKQG